MYILPINQNYTQRPVFNSKKVLLNSVVNTGAGKLKPSLSKDLSYVLRSYRDIKSKVSMLTQEGIDYIHKNYPDISIGESLIFHNCGKNNTSILVRSAESLEYSGLSRIIERKGNSSWSDRIVLKSFLIEDSDRLLKNEDENKQKLFPKEREYLTDTEISEKRLDKGLEELLPDLDFAILSFRRFLNNIGNKYDKTPDGVLPYLTISMLRQLPALNKEIDAQLAKMPKQVELSLRKSFPNYKLQTGLVTHAFKNLGKDNVTITYTPITAPDYEGFHRLNIFNEAGDLIKTYVVSDNGKMLANVNNNSTIYLPKKPIYVDAKKIELEKYSQSFQRYLMLYYEELQKLSGYIDKNALERLKYMNSIPLEYPEEVQNKMKDILSQLEQINEKIKIFPPQKGADVKKSVPGLLAVAGRKGITFEDFEKNKKVYLLPMNSNRHDGLTRLAILDPDSKKDKFYVFKDFKYLVKNFNPEYPQTTPKTLVYLKEADGIIEPEIIKAIDFLSEKMNMYYDFVANAIDSYFNDLSNVTEKNRSKKEKNLEEKAEKTAERLRLREIRAEELRQIRAERARLKNELGAKAKEEKENLIKEKAQRRYVLANCMQVLENAKRSVKNAPEEFRKSLEELKRIAEEYLNIEK